MAEIVIPYKPRKIWRETLHPALESHRFSVLVCHRRFGKTVGVINHMLKQAIICKHEAPRFAYVAPYRNQAKMIAWEYIKFYSSVIPRRKINESELYIELPTQHANRSGARIYVIGADHPDALRGGYFDGVILDEYAQIKKELWDEVIRPSLADREGWVCMIGTPKGQNQFYEMYQLALREPSWYSCLYRVDETNVIPKDELDDMMSGMSEMAIRQELYCDFSASASDIVITIDMVTESCKREILPSQVEGMPTVLGVDVARFGDDSTVITARQGLCCKWQHVFKGLDTMEVAGHVIDAINQEKAEAVYIDVGAMGAGVIDRLRQLGYDVTEVSFAAAASDQRYANKRAEMYFDLRAWMIGGGAIPDIPALKSELSVVEYKYLPFGKIQLEPKDKIKEKIGKSPDLADSLALTFAYPVMPRDMKLNKKLSKANTNYKLW